MDKIVKIDKETIDFVKQSDTELRIQEIKEQLDRLFNKNIYDNYQNDNWTDEEIAKLDYILCEIENTIVQNKDVKVIIE